VAFAGLNMFAVIPITAVVVMSLIIKTKN